MGVWGRLECGPGDGVGLGVQREGWGGGRRCGGWDWGRVEGENLRMGKRLKLADRVVVCDGS